MALGQVPRSRPSSRRQVQYLSLPMTTACQPPNVEDLMVTVLDIHTDSIVRAKSELSIRGLKRQHVHRAELHFVQFSNQRLIQRLTSRGSYNHLLAR